MCWTMPGQKRLKTTALYNKHYSIMFNRLLHYTFSNNVFINATSYL